MKIEVSLNSFFVTDCRDWGVKAKNEGRKLRFSSRKKGQKFLFCAWKKWEEKSKTHTSSSLPLDSRSYDLVFITLRAAFFQKMSIRSRPSASFFDLGTECFSFCAAVLLRIIFFEAETIQRSQTGQARQMNRVEAINIFFSVKLSSHCYFKSHDFPGVSTIYHKSGISRGIATTFFFQIKIIFLFDLPFQAWIRGDHWKLVKPIFGVSL